MSEQDWAEIEAKEIRVWIGEPEVGLWCSRCNLPSAWRAPIQRDPAETPTSWAGGCTECDEAAS